MHTHALALRAAAVLFEMLPAEVHVDAVLAEVQQGRAAVAAYAQMEEPALF